MGEVGKNDVIFPEASATRNMEESQAGKWRNLI